MQLKPDYSISTPENVDLHLELAGLGNRVLAGLVDTMVTYTIMFLLAVLATVACYGVSKVYGTGEGSAIIIGGVAMATIGACFFVNFGYYIFFEGIWRGQTPGKKLVHIRVIEQNGQPVSWTSVIIRNLIRTVDEGIALIGMLIILIDKNERRLGDLAAGTLVIRERQTDIDASTIVIQTAAKVDTRIDTGRITPEEYEILVSYLKRRAQFAKAQQPLLAEKIEKHFREKLNEPVNGQTPEEFLESLYLTYQSRAE